ncbi:MAG TPA: ABC transporter permease, partial [Thermodesulfobacterium commune]|nr:ABC transporter permease [Thermodesulfobacterium commune]
PVAFLDYDRSKLSRDYIDSFVNSEYFKLYTLVNNYKEAEGLLNSAKVRAVVIIPPDFSQKLYKKEKTEVQVLIDGTYPSRAEVVKGYISTINTLFNQKLLGNQNSLKFPIELEIRAWYNPALESKNFIMPGMLVTTLCFYPVLLSCLVV